MKKIDYQKKILEKAFKNTSMLSIIEFLNLDVESTNIALFNLIDDADELSLSKLSTTKIVLNPVIESAGISFVDSQKIVISSNQKNVYYYFTTDGSKPSKYSNLYTLPFYIDSSAEINAIAIDENGKSSFVTTASFKKMTPVWEVSLKNKYMKSYDGGGELGLVDEIHGALNWRMGNWQGYQNNNLDAVVDLKEIKPITEVGITFLQDTRSWVIMPKSVSVEVSNDGNSFTKVFEDSNFVDAKDYEVQIKKVSSKFNAQNARYIRVVAKQFGKLPEWHQGFGGDSIIFVDEIEIK